MRPAWILRWALLLATGVQTVLPDTARGSGGIVPELGTRKTAMGAVIGRPDELAAIYHNPAGLTLNRGTQLLLAAGVSLLDLDFRLRQWPGSGTYLSEPTDSEGYYPEIQPSQAFGVVPMVVASTNLLTEKLVLALGVYIPNAAGAAFDESSVARYHVIETYGIVGAATLAVAYQVLPCLSLGAGLNVLYMRYYSRRKLYPVLGQTDLGLLLGGDSEIELLGEDVAAQGTFGLLWQPLPFIGVGAVLITRTEMELEGDVTLTLGKGAAGEAGDTLGGRQRTGYLIPWTIQAGLNMDLTPWLEVGAEWRYYLFHEVLEQRTEIEDLYMVSSLVSPKRYSDSYQISGGINIRPPFVPGLDVMAGVQHDVSPAPDDTVSAEQPSFTHTSLRLGLRYRVSPRLRLAATYVHYWYEQRNTSGSQTSPPSNFIGDGGNNIITLVLELFLGRGWWIR